MQVITHCTQLRQQVQTLKARGARLALVPTMGNLHAGHMALIAQAQQQADAVLCSIFVNPLQFGPNEDLATYPRSLQQDLSDLQQQGVDCVFTPSVDELYPTGHHTRVHLGELAQRYCGARRAGHFDGVGTVVTLLFNLIQPDVALFGKKDYQQLMLIQQLTRDLQFAIEIIGVDTQRAEDGLALSSRNAYLTPQQRTCAPALYHTLCELAQRLAQPGSDAQLLEAARAQLQQQGFNVDYVHICNRQTLALAGAEDKALVILAAAYLGTTRLIDNLECTR